MTSTSADGSLRRPYDWQSRTPLDLAPPTRRDNARAIADILRRHKHVREVLLFGSLARGEWGNDIDLIVVTDHGRGSDWINLTESCVKDFAQEEEGRKGRTFRRNGLYHHRRLRMQAAIDALGIDFGNLLRHTLSLASPDRLDIFVFPPNWREYLRVLQEALPHSDPMFMQNIARDAVRI